MPKMNADGVKFVRIEVAPRQMDLMRDAAKSRPVSIWAIMALRNGLAHRGPLPTIWVRKGEPRESLFLAVPVDLLKAIDRAAAHVGVKRSAYARSCFALATGH